MWSQPRKKLKITLPVEADFLHLCRINVFNIENLVGGGNLLNHRQCQDLSSKLSRATQNVGELVIRCGASSALFQPALENLYRYLEKAKELVSKCGDEDWCAAAVFQSQNENAFRDILLDVGLCYNAIYEQARSTSKDWNVLLHDLRQSSVFGPALDCVVDEDKQDLLQRLDELASGHTSFKGLDYWIPGRIARKQSLARYLLVKMYCTSLEPQAITLDTYSAILWTKVSEPSGTWGNSRFLGAGSGASGVCSTTWLGIPCAKKEFHGQESESSFLKEAGILAHLNHPCIVDFVCCGNGLERGDRFIAMELMEKSLFDLIGEQKDVLFSLPVAVDMMVQIARGVCYLHGRGVAHRDLKPQNVVVNTLTSPHLSDHYCVKLVDFGMSKTKVEVSKSNTMTARGIGTTMYRAPEVHPKASLDGKGKVNWLKADAFSFAMTCAHLLSLKTPFRDTKANELYDELTKNARRPKLPGMCPQDLVLLLEDCWKTNPRLRPSFVEICTRLETFRHKFLRRYPSFGAFGEVLQDKIDHGVGFDFIKMKLVEESYTQSPLDDEVEDETFEWHVQILPCPCGRVLELLPHPPHNYASSYCCNICWQDGVGEVYHCEICQFDAHRDCAEIKDKVEVFFHEHPLHLLVQNFYSDDSDAICRFCEEPVQDSAWVYRCEICDFDVHALCSKYPKERMWKRLHPHLLTLVQCPPHKRVYCTCCNGEVRGNTWRYTCIKKWYSFDIHPYCAAIYFLKNICPFDNLQKLFLVSDKRGFLCAKCGGLGFSWHYHCTYCHANIHLDCMVGMEEVEDYGLGNYVKRVLEFGSKDDHNKMDAILELLDKMFTRKSLEANSLSSSMLPPVTTMVRPTIRRLTMTENIPSLDAFDDVDRVRSKIGAEIEERKAMRMAAKVAKQQSKAKSLKTLENLEKILLDLQLSSNSLEQGDAEVLASTLEMLKLQKYIVEDEMATQVQSQIRHGPRLCLFYLSNNEEKERDQLLTRLQAYMKDVRLTFLCEEPGHQHFVDDSLCRVFDGVLGRERVEKLQPLLASGLQVATSTMSTLAGQLTQLDSVTLPNLGSWDLRAVNLQKLGKPTKDKMNVEVLTRAEDSAAEWILRNLEDSGGNIYEAFGLLRVRYIATEEGASPDTHEVPWRGCALSI